MKTIDIYTDCEEFFLERAFNLLDIPYTKSTPKSAIYCVRFEYKADAEQDTLLARLMEYNYKRNM